MSTHNKWQALSMKDRAFLIREAVRNGITDINYIKEMYDDEGRRLKLGVPYRTFESGSDYDYFNAAPENMPQEDGGHWGSRNPHTGQLLKSQNHPTYNLLLGGEKQAGYKIQKIGDREYSFPNEHRFDGQSNYPARNSPILFRSPAIVDSEQEYVPLSFTNYLESIIEPVEEKNTQSKPVQERPIAILSDNSTADFRDKAARTYDNKKDSHNFNINIGPGELSKCAKYVSDYASNASGLDPEETGVYGNAWTMFGNIEKKGGAPIFNIYTDPEFADIRRSGDYKKLIAETKSRKGSLKSEYSKLQPGDVVGIFNPSSSYHTTTMREGSTFNSHVGIVSEINKEGIPIIAHTVNARDRKDPITALTGSAWGQPFVTVAARPNYTNPIKELDFNDSIVSSYEVPFIPNEESEHEKSAYRDMQTYMNSLAQAKETFRNIYPDVDWDNLEKAAIGILKRETNYMRTKQSDIASGEVGDFSDRLATFARRTYHSFKDTPQENRSRDLTKFKFNTLPLSYRKAIGLNSPEQLDKDPKITARAVLLQLGRIYDYYNRLFAKYPELGGTNEDKLNIAILSYNEGGKYHMGFDPKTGEIKPEELNKLRQISRQGYITKDISSTNYKYLNRIIPGLGDLAYDKYGDYRPGYIAAARKQMNELSESQQGHKFSGEDPLKIQTDTEHKTDNSLIERIALNIGSKDKAKDEGRANIGDIITGTIDALLGKEPRNNTNLAAFLGKPEDYGFEEITDNRGPQFDDRISQYETQNFKTYKGVINPYNEYVVSQEDYDKFLELAKTGDIFYGNADWDNVRYAYDIINSRNTMTTYNPLHKGYRDDVQNYPIQFYTKNGKLFANAADFYDFNTDSFQGRTLTKKGNPYILRQNDIPVRAIYVPEHLIDVEPRYWADDNEFTDEIRRALNMRRTIKIREEQEKLKKRKK